MPLPELRKGAVSQVPAKPKVSRREQLAAMTQELAAQTPEAHTMDAIEGIPTVLDSPRAVELQAERPQQRKKVDAVIAPDREQLRTTVPNSAIDGPGALAIRDYAIDEITPSPFQPKGRPSVAAISAVEQAIVALGSLDQLVGPDGGSVFARLDAEAARLAELAADIKIHGIKTPIELRTNEQGALECLAGHRRLAASRLAGVTTVPAIHRGKLSNAAAAEMVLRGNLHRENFTAWHEALLVADVRDQRRLDGFRDTTRSLGRVMGWSHGKVNILIRIREALSPDVLRHAKIVQREEDLLAHATYRELERLATEADEGKRITRLHQLVGRDRGGKQRKTDGAHVVHRPTRGGGFRIEVRGSIEALAAGDAAVALEALETQISRVRSRLAALKRAST